MELVDKWMNIEWVVDILDGIVPDAASGVILKL